MTPFICGKKVRSLGIQKPSAGVRAELRVKVAGTTFVSLRRSTGTDKVVWAPGNNRKVPHNTQS